MDSGREISDGWGKRGEMTEHLVTLPENERGRGNNPPKIFDL